MMAANTVQKTLGNLEIDPDENVFSDIADSPFQKEILIAFKLGIVKGVGSNRFDPDGKITREQIAVMLFNTLRAINPNRETSQQADIRFEDESQIADWAISAVTYCYENQIMRGTKPRLIEPKNRATREQAMVLMYKLACLEGVISPGGDDVERGNTAANAVNRGFVAQKGEWTYYRNSADDNKLYKVKVDGTGKEKISDEKAIQINVLGDWVYYQATDKYPLTVANLYKVRTDGTGETIALTECLGYANMVGDTIYYINWSGPDWGKLYKINIDGTGKTKLTDEQATCVTVQGEWIYYSNIDDPDKPQLYKIKTDGTERAKLADGSSWSLLVLGDWVYYSNSVDQWSL